MTADFRPKQDQSRRNPATAMPTPSPFSVRQYRSGPVAQLLPSRLAPHGPRKQKKREPHAENTACRLPRRRLDPARRRRPGGRGRRTHRDPLRPRGDGRHPQGPGRPAAAETGRGTPGRPGEGRGARQLQPGRRCRGAGRPAARRRAAARAVAGQVRAVHAQAQGVRPAVPVRRPGGGRPLPATPDRPRPAAVDEPARHHRSGLLAQRHEAAVRQPSPAAAGGRPRAEFPHPVVQGARGAVRRGRRQERQAAVRRGAQRPAGRQGAGRGKSLVEPLQPAAVPGAALHQRDQPRGAGLHAGEQCALLVRHSPPDPQRTGGDHRRSDLRGEPAGRASQCRRSRAHRRLRPEPDHRPQRHGTRCLAGGHAAGVAAV
ncbi:hypothetical protein D3C80_1188890 [compost metagenome]